MALTDEQKKETIRALIRERRHYEVHGPKERLEQVDKELRRLGHQAKTPQKRAERRSASKK
jgi:hypothetical protein